MDDVLLLMLMVLLWTAYIIGIVLLLRRMFKN